MGTFRAKASTSPVKAHCHSGHNLSNALELSAPPHTKGNRQATNGNREWPGAHTNFSEFLEIAQKLCFKLVLGQSSLPIWVLGTIEFIWAGWNPMYPHHKIISSQKYVFRDPKIAPKRSPGPNVDLGLQNPILGSKIWPEA